MAVAAHEKRLYVYMLKSMDEMRADFKETSRLQPIKAVGIRFVQSPYTPQLMNYSF